MVSHSCLTENAAKTMVMSFGDQQFTGKNTIIKEFNISMDNSIDSIYKEMGNRFKPIQKSRTVEIEVRMVCSEDDWFTEFFDEDYKPKISQKKVEDCTIKELLFAARQKAGGK